MGGGCPESALLPNATLEVLVDADLDTLATALYVRTDDLLKAHPEHLPVRPPVGLAPRITDAELLTLAVLQALGGYTSEARWLRHAQGFSRFRRTCATACANWRFRRHIALCQRLRSAGASSPPRKRIPPAPPRSRGATPATSKSSTGSSSGDNATFRRRRAPPEAQALLARAKADAAARTEERLRGAQSKIDAQLADADTRIGNARDAAMTEVEAVAADATQDIVQRLAGVQVERDAAATAVKGALTRV